MEKKRIFSGIQPTGVFTLGNYLGAVKHWKTLQETHDCMYCIVDLHAITQRQTPHVLRKQIRHSYGLMLASGVDPNKSIPFIQSHVALHTELMWILSCHSPMGPMTRMTQFKDKSQKNPQDVNLGLLTYPVLMAADILLYGIDYVPVGEDQKQHIELARDLAQRFHHIYGDTFVIPEPMIPDFGGRIMSLQDPTKKMSKSDPQNNATIFILDEPEVIRRKISKSVTDSEGAIYLSPEKQGIVNLLTIYGNCTNTSLKDTEQLFKNSSYKDLKEAVADCVIQELTPIQQQYQEYMKDPSLLDAYMEKGAEDARRIGQRMMKKVNKKVGFI